MWAYVDETGNTGNRLFDPHQPFFITTAMMTRTNFDLTFCRSVGAIANSKGVTALHANELGLARIEEIAKPLLKVLKKADARFFVSRLEKRYLAATTGGESGGPLAPLLDQVVTTDPNIQAGAIRYHRRDCSNGLGLHHR